MNLHMHPSKLTLLVPPPDRRAAALESYMTCMPDDGLDFDRFVAQGAHLLTEEDLAGLRVGFPDLREKINAIHLSWAHLGRQLDFLADFFQAQTTMLQPHLPDGLLDEVAFALLYVARDVDLLPDDLPGVGYADDAAVVAAVLERHERTFFNHCLTQQVSWDDIRHEGSLRG